MRSSSLVHVIVVSSCASVAILVSAACVGDDAAPFTSAPAGDAASSADVRPPGQGESDAQSAGDATCATACSGKCVDTTSDPDHCGACGKSCTNAKGTRFACVASQCGSGVVAVAAGAYNACVVLRDGTVWCWGNRSAGTTGEPASLTATPIPTKIPGLADVSEVALGREHACARKSDGSVWCWGLNNQLQTGSASAPNECTPIGEDTSAIRCHVPRRVELPMGVKAAQVAAGSDASCVRTEGAPGGDVYCWGRNVSGTPAGPTKVTAFAGNVREVSVSHGETQQHACVVTVDGRVWCWGAANAFGQLGERAAGPITTPAEVTKDGVPFDGVKAVRAMSHATCALRNDKTVWCWGSRFVGQTGLGSIPGPFFPVVTRVQVLDGTAALEGHGYGAWAISDTGVVRAWGETGHLTLGVMAGTTTCQDNQECISAPTIAPALAGATQISGGFLMGIALRGSTVLAWGTNDSGQLGHPTGENLDQACPDDAARKCNADPLPVGDLP